MKIEIWSDIMCPFCYIGKRHLEKALSQFKDLDKVEIVWKSFQLDPTIPRQTERVGVYEYLATSKGLTIEQSKSMHTRVEMMARETGLTYNFDNAVIGNSFDAHRLIQLAKTFNLGDEAEEALFKAYFTEGRDIADSETLISIGTEIGLSSTQVKQVLSSNEYASAVQNDIEEAREIGVSGVPFFVFERKYAISGAQPVKVFQETMQALVKNP